MIRNSLPKDCEAIYDMVCDKEHTKLDREAFEKIYHEQRNNMDYTCLVYERDGKAAGFLNLRVEWQLHHVQRIAEIMEFVVDYRNRGQGIGRQLLKAACETAEKMGCTQIEVACNQIRKRTHLFYQNQGMDRSHYKFSKCLDRMREINRLEI